MRFLFSGILFILFCTQIVFAQSDTFKIQVFNGTDTVPPSTPVLLSVVPIASTQIDLGWSASTDDYIVSGYSVWRDGVAIATTTLLNYSDAGLLASTTYSYVVRAFDSALNYSSTSNALATTTLQEPPVLPVSSSTSISEGTIARVVVEEFLVEEGVSTTSFFIRTAHPSRLEVRWGRTASYELGYTVNDVYSKEHNILLTDLQPRTKYEYEIIGYSPHGFQSVIHTGSFVTEGMVSTTLPVNVSRFQAIRNGDSVDLSWQLPKDDLISHVRIVRSHLGFPEYPQNGAIVYQGEKEFVRDEGILTLYSPVYYTAFVYDIFGNVSSGAVAMVYAVPNSELEDGVPKDEDNTSPVLIEEKATSSISTERVTVDMKMPRADEILITQTNNVLSLSDENIVLDSENNFHVSIPSSAIAGNLKSIIVTIVDPTDHRKSYSFLLRLNQNQTAYEAVVASLGVEGKSQITVEIYDYEAFVVATYKTPVSFDKALRTNKEEVLFPDIIYKNFNSVLFVVVMLPFIFTIALFLYRRKTEDNR